MIIPFFSVLTFFTNHETLFKILSVVTIIELLLLFFMTTFVVRWYGLLFLIVVAIIEALTIYFVENSLTNKLLLGTSFCGCLVPVHFLIAVLNEWSINLH